MSLGWCLIGSGFEEEEEVNAKTQRRRDAKEEGRGRGHLLRLGKSSAISRQLSVISQNRSPLFQAVRGGERRVLRRC